MDLFDLVCDPSSHLCAEILSLLSPDHAPDRTALTHPSCMYFPSWSLSPPAVPAGVNAGVFPHPLYILIFALL